MVGSVPDGAISASVDSNTCWESVLKANEVQPAEFGVGKTYQGGIVFELEL